MRTGAWLTRGADPPLSVGGLSVPSAALLLAAMLTAAPGLRAPVGLNVGPLACGAPRPSGLEPVLALSNPPDAGLGEEQLGQVGRHDYLSRSPCMGLLPLMA